MSTRHQKIVFIVLVVLLVGSILGVAGGGFYIYQVVQDFDKGFAQHVYVENIPIGGLTFEEAEQYIKEQLRNVNQQEHIILTYKDIETPVVINELSPSYDIDQVLQEAYAEGHTGNLFERFRIAQYGVSTTKNFKLLAKFTEESIASGLMNHTTVFYKEPIDATIERKNRQFILTREVEGEALDTHETAKRVKRYLENPIQDSNRIEAVMKSLPASITEEMLKVVQSPIASFYTSYNNADQNRNQNLALAAKKINSVLKPGDIFSLGNQLEPITFDEGYRASKVIVDGKLEEGIGGGVCQIASTLYNAILLTDLDIVARANHSLPVAYVPLGRDATYATDSIDFRFQNNSQYPVFIESYCDNNRVYVNIFSHTDLKEDYDSIKFTSETVKTTPPPSVKVIKDPELYVDQRIQEVTPLEGKTVKLYKLGYRNGELVNKELVNTSYYRARGEVIKEGIKERPPGEEVPQDVLSELEVDPSTIIE